MAIFGKMQSAKSLQWLPPGWIVEFKERPSGARANIYIDPVSGRKFRSKPEVLRCLRLPVPAPKETEGSSNVPAVVEFTNKKTVIRLVQDGSLENSLDWLPLNWQVEFKERKSGKVDKYFIDPMSGLKCRSRNEVSHYLQNSERPLRSRFTAGRIYNNTRTVTQLVQDGSLDPSFDWLPSNWQLELKKRETGRVDKYYTDPVTGFKFRSKNRVLDYLQKGEKPDAPGHKYLIPSAENLRRRGMLPGWRSNTRIAEKNKRVIQLSDDLSSEQHWTGTGAYNKTELAMHLSNIRDSGNRRTDRACASQGYIIALFVDSSRKRKDYNGVGRSGNKKPKHSPQETEDGSVCRVSCRTSRRLAGLDPELPFGMGKGKKIVLIEPTPDVVTENNMHSLGGDEHPDERGKQYDAEDYAADCKMEILVVEPEFKLPLPTVEEETEKYMLSLGGEENPNELEKTYEEYTADHTMKLVPDEQQSEVALARAGGVTENYVPSLGGDDMHLVGGDEHPNECGKQYDAEDSAEDCKMELQQNEFAKTCEEKDAAVAYTINVVSVEPESKVRLHDNDMGSLGGEEQPNELRKTHEVRDAVAEYTMEIVCGDPESKVTLPRAEGNTEKFVPSLGADEQENELGETYEGGDAAEGDMLKLVPDKTESEVALAIAEVVTEKYVYSVLGKEQHNVLGETDEERDAAAEYTINVVSEEPASKVTLPRTKDDIDKDVLCFDGEQKLNELVKTYHKGGAAADYKMELVPEEPESEVSLSSFEGVTEKYVPSFDVEEQLHELGKTYWKGDCAADYMINVVSEEPESEVTMGTEGDNDMDVP